VEAWQEAGFRGILEMATGSGKTLTAMIGAHRLHTEVGPLLIVVAAPYKVLVQQWCSEIEDFGIRPLDLTAANGPAGREREIASARRRLRMGVSPAEALVVTNATLNTPEFQRQIARYDGPKLLIGDECHNLGSEGFLENAPDFFEHRLGLSATPIRQYDAEGTDRLFGFFGEPCFSFTLEDAIGRCLTEYDYHVRFVELTADEMEGWRELTAQINALAWKIEAGVEDEGLDRLLLKRRKVLETASAKVAALAELLDQEDLRKLRYTLVYATDKDPSQLDKVNQLLSDRNLLFHQLTAEETGDKAKTRMILDRFQRGELQVLTAKRVLDEGVNVPQIMRAFVLASTTVKRQWVQRRGRLLRTCKAIGKDHAVIHDLVALPPLGESSALDSDSKKIARSELDRVWEFARLSRNGAAPGGPFEAVEYMRELLKGGVSLGS
jgi:superfamily II DNA or RNA helicase